MRPVGRICLYCSRMIGSEERTALCGRCLVAHHEECWNRNGRCSTFRCPGAPRTMLGAEVAYAIHADAERTNGEPRLCPFCGDRVYAGVLQAKHPSGGKAGAGPVLVFGASENPNADKGWIGRRVLGKVLGKRTWVLEGARVRARSCGKCHRLFLWGLPVADKDTQKALTGGVERYCPHCAGELWPGRILLRPEHGGARFVCEEVPDFHRDWFGHEVLDRFLLSRWNPVAKALLAHSCPDCLYTEVGGRPIYHYD